MVVATIKYVSPHTAGAGDPNDSTKKGLLTQALQGVSWWATVLLEKPVSSFHTLPTSFLPNMCPQYLTTMLSLSCKSQTSYRLWALARPLLPLRVVVSQSDSSWLMMAAL